MIGTVDCVNQAVHADGRTTVIRSHRRAVRVVTSTASHRRQALAYSDFFLLYILCHQSRVEVPEGKTPEHCWLEKWYNTAAQEGVRALAQLRRGVQDAINALGGGFLAHPANADLRERLRSGELSTLDYYRQVLRQVYRLLFLFVAEDRGLLLDPGTPAETKALYTSHYSTQRLRALAQKRRGTRHPDLCCALRLVFTGLRTGCPELALPALGSFLFAQEACPDIDDADIPNMALLAAVRHLPPDTIQTDDVQLGKRLPAVPMVLSGIHLRQLSCTSDQLGAVWLARRDGYSHPLTVFG